MPKIKMQPWIEKWLRENHHLNSIKQMMDHTGLSNSYVCHLLRTWGLEKTKEQHAAVLHNNLHKVSEPRIFTTKDNRGLEQVFINLGGNNTQRYSHYILAQAGRPVNTRTHLVRFNDGDRSNCVLENLTVLSKGSEQWKVRKEQNKDGVEARKLAIREAMEARAAAPKPLKEKADPATRKENYKATRREREKRKRAVNAIIRENEKAKAKLAAQEVKDKKAERNWQRQSKKNKKKEQRPLVLPDMSNLVAVRIDSRTTIYIKPDQNPEAEIKKYHLRRA